MSFFTPWRGEWETRRWERKLRRNGDSESPTQVRSWFRWVMSPFRPRQLSTWISRKSQSPCSPPGSISGRSSPEETAPTLQEPQKKIDWSHSTLKTLGSFYLFLVTGLASSLDAVINSPCSDDGDDKVETKIQQQKHESCRLWSSWSHVNAYKKDSLSFPTGLVWKPDNVLFSVSVLGWSQHLCMSVFIYLSSSYEQNFSSPTSNVFKFFTLSFNLAKELYT